tara:strand:- start:274 stop:747 length:474 start_codon:yes stop_codon:yes gene_type:complete
MSIRFSKLLSSGQRVEIDDVMVIVDASRYPTRNISAVHVNRANKPDFFLILMSNVLTILAVLLFVLSKDDYGGLSIFLMLVGLLLYSLIKTPYHTISFGSSGNDKDVIAIKATDVQKDLRMLSVLSQWEEHTQGTYLELLECADAINDAIEELQRGR